MRFEALSAGEIDHGLAARWRELQAASAAAGGPPLDSPYLSPGFVAAVAAVRPQVQVALAHENGTVVAFLPFQRDAAGDGEPVGGGCCDLQALIAAPAVELDPRALVRAAGLPRWRFNHLAAEQAPFLPFHQERHELVGVDLAGGFEAWAAGRRRAGSQLVKDLGRRRRNLERAAGPLRFEADTADPTVLARLLAWKSDQYRRSGYPDWTGQPWLRALFDRALASGDPHFQATLSALWAGERLAAAQLALRSGAVWHWWYPAYDPELAPWSPGLLLDLEMLRAAPALGVARVDLGRASAHKARLADLSRPAARGEVPA